MTHPCIGEFLTNVQLSERNERHEQGNQNGNLCVYQQATC